MKRSTFTSCFVAMFLVFLGVNNVSAQANCSPTCNDLVQTSLDVFCQVPLTYDMFLEDGDNPRTCTPNGPQAFIVQAMDHTGKVVASTDSDDDFLTCEDLTANLYEPFTITVKHWATGNSCWGTLVLEDKLNPTLEIQDVELWCNEPFDAEYIEWTQGAGVGFPRGFDNCDELRLTINGESRVDENRSGRDCNDLELTQVGDEIKDIECLEDPANVSAVVIRTWMLCDKFGNCVTREQVITLRRLSISQLNLPPNFDDLDRPALQLTKANGCQVNTTPDLVFDGQAHNGFPGRFGNGGTSQEPTGAPMIHGIPVSKIGDDIGFSFPWDDFGFCEINVTFEDQRIDVCVGSFKILRNWTVVDWCTGEIARHTQIIKVVDEETSIDAGGDVTISTNNNPRACEADFTPNTAEIWESCGEVRFVTMTIVGFRQRIVQNRPVWSVEQFTLAEDVPGVISGSATGDPVIVNFPPVTLGGPICNDDLSVPAVYTVTYRTTDHCGNTSEDSYEVEVVDETAPTPVCDEITQTTVGSDCRATVFAQTFDDGSFDSCGPVTLSVRRMDSNDPSFFPYVEFGPADVWKNVAGETCLVALRVTDCAGNSEECMVQVIVDDKTGSVTSVQDRTIICADLDNNGVIPTSVVASLASSTDNCGGADQNIVAVRDNRNDCFVGTVEYDFQSFDIHGVPSGVVTATVTVIDDTPVQVRFPNDFTAFCTAGTGGFTGALDPDVTGRPVISGDDCELVGVSFEDRFEFNVSGAACFKIIREWAVIDWCAFGDNPSEPQTFTHVQVISVQDQVAPVLSSEADRMVCINGTDDCSTTVSVAAPSVSDCSSDVRVRAEWVFTADTRYCGSDASGVVADASGGFTSPSFEPGILVVTFIADDGCNNVSKSTSTFDINDCKLPTPYCRDLFTAIMPSTGLVTVWASDINIASFDNCDGCASADLVFSFSTDPSDTNLTLTCTDATSRTVDMYVHDQSGNTDFCTTTINVQVNPGACGGTVQSPFTQSAISGTISNEAGETVDAVTVQAADRSVTTGVNGTYNFQLEQGADYTISAEKNMDPLNGVSTFDLVLLRKHIVGTQPLTTPYQLIAADINKSGDITAFDMVQLRQVVLQLVPNFPSNTSWRFIDADHQFTTANALAENFSEVYDVNNLSTDMSVDFIAVKVGDLNGNAVPNSFVGAESRNAAGTLAFDMEDQFVQAGQKVTVEFTSADMPTAQGFQFTLNFDGLEFGELVEGAATAANFNTVQAKRGAISTSWDGQAAEKEVVFGVTFTATTSGQLSELLSISSDQVVAEAYSTDGELLNVALNFNADNAATTFELFQNTPNPFDGETVIGFNLPQAGNATLKVLDIQGKILRSVTGDYTKGFNQISLNAKDLSATGVLYYQLESAEQVATKKMIIID